MVGILSDTMQTTITVFGPATEDTVRRTSSQVEFLFIAPVQHQPMVEVSQVTVIRNRGIEGDHRNSAALMWKRRIQKVERKAKGTPETDFSGLPAPEWCREYVRRTVGVQRQVSIMDLDALDAANAEMRRTYPEWKDMTPAQSRRNLFVRGVDLNSLVGKTLRVGGAELLGVCWAVPCSIPLVTRLANRKDYQQAEYDAFMPAFKLSGGICCEVLRGGQIELGDVLSVR